MASSGLDYTIHWGRVGVWKRWMAPGLLFFPTSASVEKAVVSRLCRDTCNSGTGCQWHMTNYSTLS